jgi:hypothetical protein
VTKYSTTSAKILSNVANNIIGIFHPCHQKMLKDIPSCSWAHVHKLMFTFIGSQYNVIGRERESFFWQYKYTTKKCGFSESQLNQSVHIDPRVCPF